ncbi:hypothetical protein [Halovivax asiaticus]|uniref:hypothetical protein n=1 Tax=Halovivax asiaticus TaxID=332953 RepID=UPI0009FBF0BC|nr:hypothetical protein [Halovivax asiaticus]
MTDQPSGRGAGDRGDGDASPHGGRGRDDREDRPRDDREGDAGASSLSRCPQCGTPVVSFTIRGPMDARAAPCGCPLAVEDVNELSGSSSS